MYSEDNVTAISGQIVCEKPNNAIYKFEGYMDQNNKKISLGADNMILRGCKLRNTEFVIGIAVFTGHDTKIM
jgi:magnesium-transporting ATPase (P-type)